MRIAAATIAALLALVLGACGESDEEKAQATVCDARADISKQVDELKALTPATFTTDAASESLRAIRNDLAQIRDAQGDLSDDRRQQVQSANQAFAGEVQDVLSQVFRSATAEDAKQQLTAALQQLAGSYEQTLARVDCS